MLFFVILNKILKRISSAMNQTEFSNLQKNKYYQNLVTQINENKKETNTNSTEFSLSSLFPFFFILKTYFNLIIKLLFNKNLI